MDFPVLSKSDIFAQFNVWRLANPMPKRACVPRRMPVSEEVKPFSTLPNRIAEKLRSFAFSETLFRFSVSPFRKPFRGGEGNAAA